MWNRSRDTPKIPKASPKQGMCGVEGSLVLGAGYKILQMPLVLWLWGNFLLALKSIISFISVALCMQVKQETPKRCLTARGSSVLCQGPSTPSVAEGRRRKMAIKLCTEIFPGSCGHQEGKCSYSCGNKAKQPWTWSDLLVCEKCTLGQFFWKCQEGNGKILRIAL